jgi:NTE family protein
MMRKIGLALGSGSARGLAHIGVIRAIEEAGIHIDMVGGTSIGALIGAAYAAGRLDELEQDFRSIDRRRIGALIDPVLPWSGFIDGKKIAGFVRAHVSLKAVEHLPIPFCAVATELSSGQEVVIREGDLIDAVRASISVPGIFSPVRWRNRILVDGGLVNPVPVSAVRALGADIVIAVDLNHHIVEEKNRARRHTRRAAGRSRPGTQDSTDYARLLERIGATFKTSGSPAVKRIRAWMEKERLPGMVEVLLGSLHIMQVQITESRLLIERPDILIRPPLGSVRLLEFDRADEVITIGYRSGVVSLGEAADRLRR